MKFIYLTAILLLLSYSLSANAKFAKNKECKTCHPLISKEYASSMHFNSTIYRDPIHKAIWDKHPINKKKGKYKCAKCHIPTADNLSDMMGKGTKGMPDPENEDIVLSTDLIAPEDTGELIGGGQRISDYNLLKTRILEEIGTTEGYEWYLDLRRYGSVPHAGFGLGVERLVKWIAGLSHIRDAIPFPRTPARVYP